MGRIVTWVGFAVVILFVIAAGIQILVREPLATVPGLTLDAIHADLAGQQGGTGVESALGWLGLGAALAVILWGFALRYRPPAMIVAIGFLWLLVLGLPGIFAASFLQGMNLADTYYVHGGAHSPGTFALYGVSVLALLAIVTLGIVASTRMRMATRSLA